MRKNTARLMLVLAALLCAPWNLARGGDIYVIAGAGIKLSLQEVREIYLGDKEFSGNVRIVPVDNRGAQADFSEKALAMSPQRYNQLWVKKAFRDALTPPALIATDGDVLEFVKRTRGGIGYVMAPPRDKDIVVIGKY